MMNVWIDKIKYVFLCLDSIENRYLYSGYKQYENSTAIFLPNIVRKISKAFIVTGFSDDAVGNVFSKQYFDLYIKKALRVLKWSESDNYCFIIYARDYESYGDKIVWYLRENYTNCKVTCYFVDMISRHRVELEHVKNLFDVVFSWDKTEAEKYGLSWCMEPFSTVFLDKINRDIPIKWDATLVASAKDRMPLMIELYEALRDRGFVCDFHLIGVSKKDRLYENEISYKSLSFEELIRHVIQSKCTIEILQQNTSSPTTRFAETALLNRMLLSNATFFRDKQKEYENVIYFEKVEDIPYERICESPNTDIDSYRKFFSNKRMINTIKDAVYGKDFFSKETSHD